MKTTPHRILGVRKDGRWIITARQGNQIARASAPGNRAGLREATEKAREKLWQKLRAN